MLEAGVTYTSRTVVAQCNTAATIGSGDLDVFATPMMVALMENAAMNAVLGVLAAGQTTVGGHIDVAHLRPSPVGAEVNATATLTAIEGRKLTFSVTASDEQGTIGEGTHIRFIVEIEKFLNKFKK